MIRENAIRPLLLLGSILFATQTAGGQSPSDYFPQNVGDHWKYISWHDTTEGSPDRWTFVDIVGDTTFGIPGETISFENQWSECNFGNPADTGVYVMQYLTFTSTGHLAHSAIGFPEDDSIMVFNPLWIYLRNPLTEGDSMIYGSEIFGVITKVISLSETITLDLGTFSNCLKISERYVVNGDLRQEDIGYYISLDYYPIAGLGLQTGTYYFNQDSMRVFRSQLIECNIETDIYSDETQMPADCELYQNYPNPFNAQTTIQYSLPTQSLVSIYIFDILGRKLETLAEGAMPEGEHQAIWNANGQTSGIYLCRIKAGDLTETKKMVLLK